MRHRIGVGVGRTSGIACSCEVVPKVAIGTVLYTSSSGGICIVRPPTILNTVESIVISEGAR